MTIVTLHIKDVIDKDIQKRQISFWHGNSQTELATFAFHSKKELKDILELLQELHDTWEIRNNSAPGMKEIK